MATTTPDNIYSPDAGDAYALTTDLAALADTAQDAITAWKNYGIGTDATRLALTTSSNPPLKEGLQWYATDTGILFRYNGTLWEHANINDTGEVAITSFQLSGTSVGVDGASRRLLNGFVRVRGHVERTASQTGTLFVLPAGMRPATIEWAVGSFGATPTCEIKFFTNGDVSIASSYAAGPFAFSHTFPAA